MAGRLRDRPHGDPPAARGSLEGNKPLNCLWLIISRSALQKALPQERGSAAPPLRGMPPRSRQGSRQQFPVQIKIPFFCNSCASLQSWPSRWSSLQHATQSATAARKGLCLQGGHTAVLFRQLCLFR